MITDFFVPALHDIKVNDVWVQQRYADKTEAIEHLKANIHNAIV